MKKYILSISFFLFTALLSMGQDLNSSTEKRVNLLTRVLASELGLNEAEYLKLKALNRERVVKSDEIAELYSNDEKLQSQKIQELEASFERKFKAMLSPTQLASYNAYQQIPDTEIAMTKPADTSVKKK